VPESEDLLREELHKVGLKVSMKQNAPSLKRVTRAEQKHKEKVRLCALIVDACNAIDFLGVSEKPEESESLNGCGTRSSK
jgi:hypothetical protein